LKYQIGTSSSTYIFNFLKHEKDWQPRASGKRMIAGLLIRVLNLKSQIVTSSSFVFRIL